MKRSLTVRGHVCVRDHHRHILHVQGMDNELIALETIQHFVETLDQYFGNVCELDLIFNFSRAYHILDEVILGGYVQEPRRGVVLNSIGKQDALVEATEG